EPRGSGNAPIPTGRASPPGHDPGPAAGIGLFPAPSLSSVGRSAFGQAGLLARASSPRPAFPAFQRPVALPGRNSSLTVAGPRSTCTCLPFTVLPVSKAPVLTSICSCRDQTYTQ